MAEQQMDRARVFEVGPRDGLQNEQAILSVETRIALIERLVEAGVQDIEIGSFVHPKWLPQMANTDEVARRMTRRDGVRYWALVPNMRGLERALQTNITHIAVFVSASETHNRKNLNRSVDESMAEIREVMSAAVDSGVEARAYVSMVFGCPYEGKISFDRVLDISESLLAMGVGMISLGDTTGIGTPLQVRQGCHRALERFGPERLALHLHDTRGMGVTNAMVAWEAGMRAFDSSVGGIGGCPYAPGAAGNLGSEDLVYLFDSMGVETGISLDALGATSRWLEEAAGIKVPSRCTNYMQSARRDL
jgi:hydroxymethylglutaryl-CoA lyase